MAFNLLSFIIIAVSFSKLSLAVPSFMHACPPGAMINQPLAHAHPPSPSLSGHQLEYLGTHQPPLTEHSFSNPMGVGPQVDNKVPLHKWCEGNDRLFQVSALHSAHIQSKPMPPLSLENQVAWRQESKTYQSLPKEDDRTSLRQFLHQWFAGPLTSEPGLANRASAHAWSLAQSKRLDSGGAPIWWRESLVKANSQYNEFIDLIKIGDRLHFFHAKTPFTFEGKKEDIVTEIADILYHDGKSPRKSALKINSLIAYLGQDQVSMYKARVGQLMVSALTDFHSLSEDKRTLAVRNIYLFLGKPPLKVNELAQKAMKTKLCDVLVKIDKKMPSYDYYSKIEKLLG